MQFVLLLYLYSEIEDLGLTKTLKQFKYFTRWGEWLTYLALVMGSFTTNHDCEAIEDFNYQDLDFHHRKYTPFRAWKWYIFLYETALVYELIIAPFFWFVLYPGLPDVEGILFLSLVCDHSVPLAVLLVDYMFNQVPFAQRHLIPMLIMAAVYLVINYLCTKSSGVPVYPPMDWQTPFGIALPFLLALGALVIFYVFYFLTILKLYLSGYIDMVRVVQGYQIVAETNEDVFGQNAHFAASEPDNKNYALMEKPSDRIEKIKKAKTAKLDRSQSV